VLATNVAETSLTVPGIRYVIDTGLARVKRYSYRNKVEQLQVEPISQAAANQRAGRCGRVANGICIRLYDEKDFAGRPRFTDPEILRSSLAGVILRMKSAAPGHGGRLPLPGSAAPKAIADGYALLDELNAVDDDNELTAIGQELARLPLDPRVGRMILEARGPRGAERGAGHRLRAERPGRARPPDGQAQAADESTASSTTRSPSSCGYLKLWKWIEEGRGCTAPGAQQVADAQAQQPPAGAAPARQLRQPAQGARVARHPLAAAHRGGRARLAPEHAAGHLRADPPVAAGRPAGQHRLQERRRGLVPGRARHQVLAPPGRAPEQEARPLAGGGRAGGDHAPVRPRLAAIEPQWLPGIAGHLLKKQLLEPHWEKKAAEVVALERATLYGIVVYNNRRVNFGRVDPEGGARDLHPRSPGGRRVGNALPFLAHNRKLIAQVQELEHKAAARTCWWTTS
jgi:ATP-dependent helicase HrpA